MRRTSTRGRALCRRFCRHSDAASLGEYAVMLGVIAVALVLVLSQFKDAIGNGIGRAATTLSSAETGQANGQANGQSGQNNGQANGQNGQQGQGRGPGGSK